MNHTTDNKETTPKDSRFILAIAFTWVVVPGILVLSLLTIILSYFHNPDKFAENTQFLFGGLFPLVGTWVGTILAFYFSKENFESAARNVKEIAKEFTSIDKLRSIPVTKKMIPKMKMFYMNTIDHPVGRMTLKEILDELARENRNRLPFLDNNGAPQYIIHRSMIEKYLTKKTFERQLNMDALKSLTLQNILNEDPIIKKLFENSFAIVSEDANLADAKLAMDKIVDCLDVFVTRNGRREEPVIGWLTNLIITENAIV